MKRRRLTAAEKRALASAGLTITRYTADGERVEIRQLTPESDERRRTFATRLAHDTPARDEEA